MPPYEAQGELRRIPLPRTPVNGRKYKCQTITLPALRFLSVALYGVL
jgi:hypothetical protein